MDTLTLDRIKNRQQRIILDVVPQKYDFLMELLNSFSFVKTQPITEDLLLQEIKEDADIVTEMNEKVEKKPLFAETFGMWAGRDIDIKEIRKARRERRTKYYDNATL